MIQKTEFQIQVFQFYKILSRHLSFINSIRYLKKPQKEQNSSSKMIFSSVFNGQATIQGHSQVKKIWATLKSKKFGASIDILLLSNFNSKVCMIKLKEIYTIISFFIIHRTMVICKQLNMKYINVRVSKSNQMKIFL